MWQSFQLWFPMKIVLWLVVNLKNLALAGTFIISKCYYCLYSSSSLRLVTTLNLALLLPSVFFLLDSKFLNYQNILTYSDTNSLRTLLSWVLWLLYITGSKPFYKILLSLFFFLPFLHLFILLDKTNQVWWFPLGVLFCIISDYYSYGFEQTHAYLVGNTLPGY